ncbi:hypothetical protein METBIDRAFT_40144 [Metschnikowia bicuspidata var. bicuspidata NRRL YB-4993]|uniref:A to I editase domain-containing protein n=1 Tax=Metschnikowia bicuspidata var. bicuspidata NRRL YB-4993 TaxID=869754 RepID=A0A1A0HDL9_9ASCO|nr:hypothetical protein METBIDRAFT_40144 [Metschnikowia bicuspidata var. bicuspidata NRRL YB-4993]OBA21992.1 hypothetical protein METBIDRAFT_40144 [Metschnikowia bicuspidata var. bicuspidata NRRL YB-4993]
MSRDHLGQRIADAVEAHFEKASGKGGRPGVRPGGVAEWTVLAGLVAVDGDSLTVLSAATGVKAMPDCVRRYSRGLIVHDMHAEILCLRMFNWYVVEEVKHAARRRFLEPTGAAGPGGPRFRWRPGVRLALYVSEPPCGDASMAHDEAGKEATEKRSTEKRSRTTPAAPATDGPAAKKHSAVRGRAGFGDLGVVRTKPGRADSRVSFSKSCSDKLCAKQFTGILNCVASVRVDPVFLDFLVVAEQKHSPADFRRCFVSRLGPLPPPPPHALQVLTFGASRYAYAKHAGRVPLPLSWVSCPVAGTAHVLSQGVRNGAHVKNGPPRRAGASTLCRRSLWEHAQGEVPVHGSYRQFKQAAVGRERRKHEARAALGAWPACAEDDFAV